MCQSHNCPDPQNNGGLHRLELENCQRAINSGERGRRALKIRVEHYADATSATAGSLRR